MIKSEIDTATGVWSDILSGNLSGVSYRMGQNTAMGVEMLVVNVAGKVVGKTIGLIESVEYNPTLNLCIAICKALGKTLNDLFWEESI